MTNRLATLVAAAALAALPGIASAATMKHMAPPAMSEATIMGGPAVPAGDTDTGDLANAELGYLAEVCPTVIARPGSYSPTLANFCQQPRG
jgi:hypothetical protein